MLWITNKNICTLIYIALQTSPILNNSYIIVFLKTVHCISLRPSEKNPESKIFFKHISVRRGLLILRSSCQIVHGWRHIAPVSRGTDPCGAKITRTCFCTYEFLLTKKPPGMSYRVSFVLIYIRIIARRNCALCFLFHTSFQCFYTMAYLNILWV